MAVRERYREGEFCWVDLLAVDVRAAETFYSGVFGWSVDVRHTHGGPPYGMFRLRDHAVAGVRPVSDAMPSDGMPPRWNSYVRVDSVDATVERARRLGATITVAPMDVLDIGRLAFLVDPTGAHLGLWQPGVHGGATAVGEPGAFCWNELASRDTEAARRFFGECLGWEFARLEHAPSPYWVIRLDERDAGGIIEMSPEWGDAPPHWSVYFAVEDTDRAADGVVSAGGRTLVPPFDATAGRIAVVSDDTGARFSVIRLADTGA